MDNDTLTVSEAKNAFARLLERVHHRGDRVRLVKHGREMVAVVPIEDLALIEKIEDAADAEAVRKALAEGGKPIPLSSLREELGL